MYPSEAVCFNRCIPRSVATGHRGFHNLLLLYIDVSEFPVVGICRYRIDLDCKANKFPPSHTLAAGQ